MLLVSVAVLSLAVQEKGSVVAKQQIPDKWDIAISAIRSEKVNWGCKIYKQDPRFAHVWVDLRDLYSEYSLVSVKYSIELLDKAGRIISTKVLPFTNKNVTKLAPPETYQAFPPIGRGVAKVRPVKLLYTLFRGDTVILVNGPGSPSYEGFGHLTLPRVIGSHPRGRID